MNEWLTLAEGFSSEAIRNPETGKNLIALSRICEFLSSSRYGQELAPSKESGLARLVLIRRDGSYATKCLRVRSLAENNIEFCLRDGSVERYFHPDEPHLYALDRFQEVLRSIDWRKPVTQPTFFENLSATFKAFFSKRYNGG